MPEIEWLDDDARAGGEPDGGVDSGVDTPPDATAHDDRAVLTGVAVLWAAAAAAAARASFGSVYYVHFGGSAVPDAGVDGWGRYSGNAAAVSGAHGTRYGVALCIVAALLLAVALAALLRLARPDGDGSTYRIGRPVGLGVTCALIGVVAAAGLAAQAALDSIRAALRLELLDTADRAASTTNAQLHHGSLIWFGVAAAGCAALALLMPSIVGLATHWVGRRRRRDQLTGPLDDRSVHPDDEALTSGPAR